MSKSKSKSRRRGRKQMRRRLAQESCELRLRIKVPEDAYRPTGDDWRGDEWGEREREKEDERNVQQVRKARLAKAAAIEAQFEI